MNRPCRRFLRSGWRVPRTRGDEPVMEPVLAKIRAVFPAHAGMNRLGRSSTTPRWGVPRTRGDEPD